MQIETFMLFVGANNTTKKVEDRKLKALLSSRLEGWTIQSAQGAWHGNSEPSRIVYITATKEDMLSLCQLLCRELEQDAVAVMPAPSMQFVTA